MHTEAENVELRIEYSPEFNYCVRFIKAERSVAGGCVDVQWTFAVSCLIRHSGGKFTYEANNIHFDESQLCSFIDQLEAIRSGKGARAELTDYMSTFGLHRQGHRLKATILIREGAGDLTTLNASFEVDYDLFVNKLHEQARSFLGELRRVVPTNLS